MAVGIYLYFLFLARGLRSTALSMLEYRGREGCADRRAGRAEVRLGRGPPARRDREHRKITLPRHDEPRVAHAAQRHPRLFRGDEGGDVRAAGKSEVQRIRRQHPRQRQAPVAPHQRDPRPDAHRVRPLRAARGAGAPRRYHRRVPSPAEAARRGQGHRNDPRRASPTCPSCGPTSAPCARSAST